jgi:hypothetical protein
MNRLIKSLFCGAACAAIQGCGGGDSMQAPQAAAPRIVGLTNQTVPQDTSTGVLNFQISDADSDPAQVLVTVQSLDATLVRPEGIALGGSGAMRTLRITPAEDAKGSAQISVHAVDPTGRVADQTLLLTVNAVTASFRTSTSDAYAANEGDVPRVVSGVTFTADADDDPVAFDALLQ